MKKLRRLCTCTYTQIDKSVVQRIEREREREREREAHAYYCVNTFTSNVASILASFSFLSRNDIVRDRWKRDIWEIMPIRRVNHPGRKYLWVSAARASSFCSCIPSAPPPAFRAASSPSYHREREINTLTDGWRVSRGVLQRFIVFLPREPRWGFGCPNWLKRIVKIFGNSP